MGIDTAAGLVGVSGATQELLVRDLEDRLVVGHGFAVATLNLDHIVKLRRDSDFLAAYLRHSHVVADGNPVVWLHRLAGRRVELITGSDLVHPLVEMAARSGMPVAFFGTTQLALDTAGEVLMARYPQLELVSRLSPSPGFDPNSLEADAAISRIESSGARVCLVALGAPKQEVFVARAMQKIPYCGFVSVGAGLDFVAGTQRRAPKLMRRLALEWVWRLAGDHRRLARRYRDCAAVLPGLALIALRARFSGGSSNARLTKASEFQPEASRTELLDE